jgi:hypothetical protein
MPRAGRLVRRPAALRHPTAVALSSGREARRGLSAPSLGRPLAAWLGNPARPHRLEPRLQKRRPKRVPLMITPRPARRQPLVQHALRGELQAIRVLPEWPEV